MISAVKHIVGEKMPGLTTADDSSKNVLFQFFDLYKRYPYIYIYITIAHDNHFDVLNGFSQNYIWMSIDKTYLSRNF